MIDEHYLTYVRQLPCCICRAPGPNDAHHLIGHGRGGNSRVSHGMTMPLCRFHHSELHTAGWRVWEDRHGMQPMFILRTLDKAIADGFFNGQAPEGKPMIVMSGAEIARRTRPKTKIDLRTRKVVKRTSATASPSKCLPRR